MGVVVGVALPYDAHYRLMIVTAIAYQILYEVEERHMIESVDERRRRQKQVIKEMGDSSRVSHCLEEIKDDRPPR